MRSSSYKAAHNGNLDLFLRRIELRDGEVPSRVADHPINCIEEMLPWSAQNTTAVQKRVYNYQSPHTKAKRRIENGIEHEGQRAPQCRYAAH